MDREACTCELTESFDQASPVIPREARTFQGIAAKLFSSAPENMRNCRIYDKLLTLSKDFLKNKIDT